MACEAAPTVTPWPHREPPSLAACEPALGIGLFALFVFTLGNRMPARLWREPLIARAVY